MDNSIKMLAHRGFKINAPENTNSSFLSAYNEKFDGVELDLHLTKDNEIVIIHDENTLRTSLENYDISNANLEELKLLNIGKYYNKNLNEQIMTLTEFLIAYANKFELINFELKTNVNRYPGIEKKVYELILPFKQYWKGFIFSSFNFDSLKVLKNIDKNIQCAYLWSRNKNFTKITQSDILNICNFLNPKYSLLKKHIIEYNKLHIKYIVWDVNTKKELNTILDNKCLFAVIMNNKLF